MATGEITLSRILTDIYDNWGTLASLAANILIIINRKKRYTCFISEDVLPDVQNGENTTSYHLPFPKNFDDLCSK